MAIEFTVDHDHTARTDDAEEQLTGWIKFSVENRPAGDFRVHYSDPPKATNLPARHGWLAADGHMYKDQSITAPFRLTANDPAFNLEHLTYRADPDLKTALGAPVSVPHFYFPAPDTDTTLYLTRVMQAPEQPVMQVRTRGYAEDILDAGHIGLTVLTATDATTARSVLADGTGVVELDSFKSALIATDDQLFAAARSAAKMQTPIGAIRFPARKVSLTAASKGTVVYSGMRLLPPDGGAVAKDTEVNANLAPCVVEVTGIGTETDSLFVMPASGKVFNVLIDGLAFKDVSNSGAGGSAQFWYGPNAGAVLWCSEMRDLTFLNFKSVLGSRANAMAIDQCLFTGHWQIHGFTDAAINLGGSDNQLWLNGYLNIGTYAAAPTGFWNSGYQMMLGELSTTQIGYIYNTVGPGWKGLFLQGGSGDGGGWDCVFFGGVVEGTPYVVDPTKAATNVLVNIAGGQWKFIGTRFANVDDSKVATGAITQSGGKVTFTACGWQRWDNGSPTFPWLYRTGGKASVSQLTNAFEANGELCYERTPQGKVVPLYDKNDLSYPTSGSLAPCQANTLGTETYTIVNGLVTQIAGLTINAGAYAPVVGDSILIPGAPDASGAGTANSATLATGSIIYKVTSLAGGNIALEPRADMLTNPGGKVVYVENNGGWGAGTYWTFKSPTTNGQFTLGTTRVWLTNGLATGAMTVNTLVVSGSKTQTIQSNSAATSGKTLTLPAVGDDTLVSRTSTDTLTNKTLTSPSLTTPKIDTVLDSNGNKSFVVGAAATAVNWLQINNAPTNVAPGLQAFGADPNIGITLFPKGFGALTVYVPAGSTPTVGGYGPDTDHDLNLTTKGAGLVKANGVAVDTISAANTLTNKTLTAPKISGGSGTATISAGTGSPEGVKTATVGSQYMRTDGGAGTTFYVKESGSGSTGWVAK
ncbi:hypothetical protein [Mycolicibacterium sphagni]|uniref:Uncharacterized protein n=1 Tax=Mycolicibacterium sphagni TaxID=1786 RepID=A0A255DP09_9MYCO|nr:hypothetical protein [Mycolicibacterium sphagni]OYN80411.1 hypothetical protein CG716_09780 [Mycolicibacterium sphagni]